MPLATEILIPTPMIIPATILAVLLLGATCRTADARVKAIYVFGDSTADVGNNNYLPGDASTKADYEHNGIDYPTGVPTGRFCNGYIGVDFLAQKMGFKESPPAALSVANPSQELNGVNFASGGSGVFDTTGENVSLSMNTQIKFFESSVKRLKASMGERKAKIFLAKSMFIFSTANNDMFAFFAETGGLNQTLNRHFVSSLSAQFKRQLQKLYDLGVRKFAIFGTGMVGCTPALRGLSSSGECVAVLNDLSRSYNKATRRMLWSLKLKLSGFKFSFANAHEITTHIAAGFKETKSACCGVGAWNGEAPCTPNTTYCANRDEYLMWDYAHPTQASYKIIADLAFDGWWSYAMPINFRLLALLD